MITPRSLVCYEMSRDASSARTAAVFESVALLSRCWGEGVMGTLAPTIHGVHFLVVPMKKLFHAVINEEIYGQ